MSMQIVNTVDKKVVIVLNERLRRLIKEAKECSSEYSYNQIKKAQKSLYQAQELYSTLVQLDKLDTDISLYDISSTESKIESIMEEKLRNRKRA